MFAQNESNQPACLCGLTNGAQQHSLSLSLSLTVCVSLPASQPVCMEGLLGVPSGRGKSWTAFIVPNTPVSLHHNYIDLRIG